MVDDDKQAAQPAARADREHSIAAPPPTSVEVPADIGQVVAAAQAEGVTHELKTWPKYFSALLEGSKTFELRRDDRGFKVGDRLRLREWDYNTEYSGRELMYRVTYIAQDTNWLQCGCVAMGIARLSPPSDLTYPNATPTEYQQAIRQLITLEKSLKAARAECDRLQAELAEARRAIRAC